VASRVTKYVTSFTGTSFCFTLHIIIIYYIFYYNIIYYFKSLTFFREIIPQSCYFNIFRDLIIYLRDLIKSPFLSTPCDIYTVTCVVYVIQILGLHRLRPTRQALYLRTDTKFALRNVFSNKNRIDKIRVFMTVTDSLCCTWSAYLTLCWCKCAEIGTSSIDLPKWIDFARRREPNPVSETLCFK
jgi:hypothetical protein